MLAIIFCMWLVGLRGLVVADKYTYNIESGYPGKEHYVWGDKDGKRCVLLVQGPEDHNASWEDKWKHVQECKYVFHYCTADQAQGRKLEEVAKFINPFHSNWGGNHFYIVPLPKKGDLTKEERDSDTISGAYNGLVKYIDAKGDKHDPGHKGMAPYGNTWKSTEVRCPNPYKLTMEERIIYDL